MPQARKVINMIKLENTVTPSPEQWQATIRGARNPMNSWGKSDSQFWPGNMRIGENDLDLMKRLIKAGTDHSKFMRFLSVMVDITAPLYWWSEYDTYKVGTVANSCSKMHKLMSKPFEMSDFSFDKLPGFKNEIKQFRPEIDEESEIWKKIDDDYEVSDKGRIRHGMRVLSGSVHKDNYILVTLHRKQQPIHRIVAKAFIPNPDNKPEVNHIDGNKMNNATNNLEWVTSSENQTHAMKNGLQPKPVSTYKGKFTSEQRNEIKRLWDSGEISRRQLARMYGVSHTCICDIINDKYKYAESVNTFEESARPVIDMLNELRDSYLNCDDKASKKHIWYTIIQLLPSSYNQKRTVMLNYAVLRNIYHARAGHKLDEWQQFREWIETLPYSELITMDSVTKSNKDKIAELCEILKSDKLIREAFCGSVASALYEIPDGVDLSVQEIAERITNRVVGDENGSN